MTEAVRLPYEVGDKVMIQDDYHVYEVVRVDPNRGVYIFTKTVLTLSKIHVYAQPKMNRLVMWHKKPDGTVWTSENFHSQAYRPDKENE